MFRPFALPPTARLSVLEAVIIIAVLGLSVYHMSQHVLSWHSTAAYFLVGDHAADEVMKTEMANGAK